MANSDLNDIKKFIYNDIAETKKETINENSKTIGKEDKKSISKNFHIPVVKKEIKPKKMVISVHLEEINFLCLKEFNFKNEMKMTESVNFIIKEYFKK